MDEKVVCHRLRREFDKVGLTVILYYLMMSFLVFAAMLIQQVVLALQNADMESEAVQQALASNGWGYIITIAIGFGILLIWKKPAFCFRTIWQKNRTMGFGTFMALLCIFVSGQFLFRIIAILMEMVAKLMGFSIMDSLNSATNVGGSFSMFFYACILAPIFEEVLFRGLLLRWMEPFGKKFSVLATAFLFGLFHANLVQSPFAFAVGLVLGYVTVEYGMLWAVILHGINNLVLGDLLFRLTSSLAPWVGEVIFFGIVGVCTLVGTIVMLLKRRKIWAYFRIGRIHPWSVKSFFTSPGILIFTVLMVGTIAATVLMMALA